MLKTSLLIFLCAATASAATISGTVNNGTTGKPAVGDDVILIKLQQSMQEESRTKTDSQGRYSLTTSDDSIPHLVRVMHQKVMYHQPAPPGTTKADVQVFDAAPKVAGVTGIVDLMLLQTDSTGLQVTETYGVRNSSSPPRTLMSDRTLEIYLPTGAAIDQGMAQGPGGMPVRSAPVPLGDKDKDKNHYAFIFPIRPGETRFQLSYHLPYNGSFSFAPRLTLPVDNLAVMLPHSMQFASAVPGRFESGDENGVAVQVAKNVAAGNAPAFKVSGTGVVPGDALADDSKAAANTATATNRPGGGIGVPESTPDPLANYRWYIVGLVALVLAAGAFWITNRRPVSAPTAAGGFSSGGSSSGGASFRSPSAQSGEKRGEFPAGTPSFRLTSAKSGEFADHSALLLEALKEELFQLETERAENKISAAEYDQAKSALQQTLTRALRRRQS